MITIEYMELAGRCNNQICGKDKRDGEEAMCVQAEPKSSHVADCYCKKCTFWEATPEKQQRITIENGE
jgi:hypothetical protein